MSKPKRAGGLSHFTFAASIIAILTFGFGTVVFAETTEKETRKAELDGEQLYAINCNRCHSERYPTERTKAQWKTIMMHMRVRANLTGDEYRIILEFLKNGN